MRPNIGRPTLATVLRRFRPVPIDRGERRHPVLAQTERVAGGQVGQNRLQGIDETLNVELKTQAWLWR
jgi:hypothetical protein